MAKVVLEEVVTELKLVKIVVILAVMVTFQQSFSAITSPVTTVNDCRPAVTLSAGFLVALKVAFVNIDTLQIIITSSTC